MAIGATGHRFDRLPKGVAARPPQARDAITLPLWPNMAKGAVTKITVRNDRRYTQPYGQERTARDPVRAEYSTEQAPVTWYQEGDVRAYNLSVLLDPSWQADRPESPDIFMQFKRVRGQPDMFLAIKGKDLILRIGRDRQLDVIKDVEPGRWIDLALRVQWSQGAAGRVDVASRGVGKDEPFSKPKAITGANMDTRGGKAYVKFGIYKPAGFAPRPHPQEHSLYLSNLSILAP
jgi:hypothetical protein